MIGRLTRLVAGCVALAWSASASAETLTPARLTLEFRVYGPTAPTLLADAKGYFRDAGIAVKIDGGSGSGEAIKRVAGGTHDFGIADIGTLVEFSARNPEAAPKAVLIVFDTAAHAIAAFTRSGISRPTDLAGRRLVTGQADATARIFPSFARLVGLDLARVTVTPVDVRLRDAMLLRGEADASLGFGYTMLFNLLSQNVPRADVTVIDFTDYGFAMYGNALIASRAMIEQHPDMVRGVARALARGWVDAVADPAEAIRALVKADPLTPPDLEEQRLRYVIAHHVLTTTTQASGLGGIDPARLDRTIRLIAEGFGLPRAPTADEIYDGRFLPDLADRRFR